MTSEKFLEEFRNQFDETNPDLIQMDTKYKELDEWSSMMALVIIAFVDESFEKTLGADDFSASQTVSDLYKCIISK